MNSNKEYPIRISPEILELLGPSLYTNIYYVLAELIANSYDADAENVWLDLSGDSIIIEDDGHGMTYEETVNKYLDGFEKTKHRDKPSKLNSYYELISSLLNSDTQVFHYRSALYRYLVDNY